MKLIYSTIKLLPLLLALLCCNTQNLSAQYILNDFDVVVSDGVVIWHNTDSTSWGTGDVILPDTLAGQAIIGIADRALYECGIRKIKLPNNLEYIESEALALNNITELTLPDKLTYIGSYAFNYSKITSLHIPKSISFIGRAAFQSNSITELTFEENSEIRIIDDAAFHNNYNLRIKLPTNSNEGFNGYIDNTGKKYEVGSYIFEDDFFNKSYYADIPLHTLTIEDVTLDSSSITRSDSYRKLRIPANINSQKIQSVGEYLFIYNSIDSLILSEGIEVINGYAFLGNKLTSLELPLSIDSIGKYAFWNNGIKNIIIPKNLQQISDRSFGANYSSNINLHNGITHIMKEAFFYNGCDSIKLPTSVEYIGEKAFEPIRNIDLEYKLDSIVLPQTVIKEGYTFSHWESSIGDTVTQIDDFELSYQAYFNPAVSFEVSGSIEIDEPYGIFINISGDIDIVEYADTSGQFSFQLNQGRNVTITPEREGYEFSPEQITLNSINADTSQLNFTGTILSYTATFNAGEHGSLDGENIQNIIYKQQTSAVAAIPDEGCEFVEWQLTDGSRYSSENPLTLTIKSDIELTAVFEKTINISEPKSGEFKWYPNPAKDMITISAQEVIEKVEIFNITGQKTNSFNFGNSNNINLDISAYREGLYCIQVWIEGVAYTKQIAIH